MAETLSQKLQSLPSIRETIEISGLRAEKKFGQNFILDSNVTDKIARAAGDLSDKNVIEIGPGPGGLTRSLLNAGAKSVTAIEYDPRAVEALKPLVAAAENKLTIVQGDALEVDLTTLVPSGPRVIVANLPYNVATPLLIGWLSQIHADPASYDRLVLMFQKEVGDRILASTNTKTYGRLSIMSQWLCHVERAFDLPPSVFVPPPKIMSSVIVLNPRKQTGQQPSFETMERIVGLAFQQRRKMLRKSLKEYCELLDACDIDETYRAESLDFQAYLKLARASEND
ncbi:MAG: 16S rRNA (adenine(1518)-N(6)/adenine(1519)-N(6))-dimethyltransferase RsmA [Pseudobdellovibrionaceae bacterium]